TLLFFVIIISWLSFIVYNLYLSPYKHIPGPLISKIIPLYDLYFMINGTFHMHLSNLHNIYGPVVRISLDKISINDVDSWKQIHNNYKFEKTDFYNHMRTVGWSMISIKDRKQHSSRRRTASRAFSENNILKLEAIVIESGVNKLVNKLKELNGNAVDMSKEFIYLAYDVIGKLVFSKDFNLLGGSYHTILDWIRNLMIFVVLNAVVPPVRLFGNPYYKNLAIMAKDSILQRKQMIENGEEIPNDLLNSLIHAKDPVTDEPISMVDLMEECAELLLAGSDTTGHTLTWALYLILKHPEVKVKLEKEIRQVFPSTKDPLSYKKIIQDLPYFQKVLKEILRYYPVGSHPMLRKVPHAVTLNGYFLPEDTELFTNCYAMHHSERYWDQPEKFNPDRFDDRKNNDLKAFLPFSSGPRSCIGRNLANLELSLTLVALFLNFDILLKD
ncbi:cytochrome P450, partial [Neoconidiobolus thromboides FSU 785]